MKPTSEQELKQLLDEGKITEEEYKELLEAIRQKETVQKTVGVQQVSTESKSHSGYGNAALILFIISITLPMIAVMMVLVFRGIGVRMMLFIPILPLSLICAFLSFIFGIVGWRTVQGKIAAIGVPCLGLLIFSSLLLILPLAYHGSRVPAESEYLVYHKAYPLDTMEGVLTEDNVNIDDTVFAEGNGSLRIESGSPEKRTIRLFETGPMGIDECILFYSAKLKSDLNNGKSYLEMWCDIPGKGEFFSRDLEHPVAGITNWTTEQTPFRLESGQMPANIKMNLVIEGVGTVWIDDIKLLSSPLSELRNSNSWH